MIPFKKTILVFMLCPVMLQAAFEELPASAESSSLSNAVVADTGLYALWINPAGVTNSLTPKIQMSSAYLFNLSELPVHTLNSAIPISGGALGLGIQFFGNRQYREWRFGKSWTQRFGAGFHAGICFITQGLQIEHYGSTVTWQINTGLIYNILPELSWGMSLSNITGNRMGGANEPLPRITRMGLVYSPAGNCKILMELDKDVRFPIEWKSGLEYTIWNGFDLRWGFIQRPAMMTAGLGFNWRRMQIDYGYRWHPVLGPTHVMSVGWE